MGHLDASADWGPKALSLPARKTYIRVPAVDQGYAKGLSLWQHKVTRRYAQRQLSARTDIAALAQAKAEIRELVERDWERKAAPQSKAAPQTTACPIFARASRQERYLRL